MAANAGRKLSSPECRSILTAAMRSQCQVWIHVIGRQLHDREIHCAYPRHDFGFSQPAGRQGFRPNTIPIAPCSRSSGGKDHAYLLSRGHT